MSFPPDVPLVTLEFGPFLDVAGQPLSQVIRIDPPQPIIHVPTGATIFDGHALVAHHATVQLLPTDLEEASPKGYTLTVTVGTQKRHIHLPQAIPHVNYQKLVAEQTEDHGEVWYPAEWAIDQAARAEAAADAAEDSEQAAAGHATDAQAALDLTVTARDLTLDYRDTAAGHAATATEQAGLATTARTGAEAALAATLAASTIVGVGRPDIPATLTTPGTAALVAAATSGTVFRSTNGPQGAWEWRKRGTAWVCEELDIMREYGLAEIQAAFPSVVWSRLSRVGDLVHFTAYGTAPSGSVDLQLPGFFPSGFRCATPAFSVAAVAATTGGPRVVATVYVNGRLDLRAVASGSFGLDVSWRTPDAVPTTLPGTAT